MLALGGRDPRGGDMEKLRLVVAAMTVALVVTATAAAEIDEYFGYNYLSPTSPTGECGSDTGVACSGFNNWDRHRVYKNSGENIHIAYQASDGTPYYCGGPFSGTGTFVILRTSCSAPTFNRVFCQYYGGLSSYVKCEAIIF